MERALAPGTHALRAQRRRAVTRARRDLVLDAARSAFVELGLEGASLREIAKRAGYTPGAIYSYFASKEEVYAALLVESLERLNERVAQAATAAGGAEAALRAHARAFFDFYREHPRELDLGLYLYRGMRPRGLTPALDERLNARLHDALAPAQQALSALGLGTADALAEVTALFAHTVGLLMLAHTGRIKMFRQQADELFERYLDSLVARCGRARRAR